MKIDAGQAISILANVGVIAGIFFLAFELRQNNDLLATQARTTLLNARVTQQQLSATNSGGINELMSKSRAGEQLTPAEFSQLRSYWSLMLYNFAAVHKEVLEGPLVASDIPRAQWAANFQYSPDLVEFWNIAKRDFDPEFVEFIESEILPYDLER